MTGSVPSVILLQAAGGMFGSGLEPVQADARRGVRSSTTSLSPSVSRARRTRAASSNFSFALLYASRRRVRAGAVWLRYESEAHGDCSVDPGHSVLSESAEAVNEAAAVHRTELGESF